MDWDYDNAPTDPRHGGKLTADMAAALIAELERITRGQAAMLNEIAEAAGFEMGQTYSAFSLIDALRRQGTVKDDGRSAECA